MDEMVEFGGSIHDLSPEDLAMFERFLEEEACAAPQLRAIPRRAPDGELPLSFAQERLWFLDQLSPGNPAYNIPLALRLSGPLDILALHRSLEALVERHETLRTRFAVVGGQPAATLAADAVISLNVRDLRALPRGAREQEAGRRAVSDVQRPFDLEHEPLLRAEIFRLDDQEYALLLLLHHIVFDGWSTGVLLQELAVLYAARSGRDAGLPELPIQYADYAAWQRQQLQGAALESLLGYWSRQLAGAPELLGLPTDRARPPAPSYRGASQFFTLPHALVDALTALAQQEQGTLFMALLTAFQILLARYSGQDDIVVGTPVANRTRAELEPLIGFFVNMLPLRTDLSGGLSGREALRRVRDVALAAYTHQDLPFEQLIDSLQLARNLSYPPLFQSVLVLQNAPLQTLQFGDVRLQDWELASSLAKFDLQVGLWSSGQGLRGEILYNTDLFDAPTIARMAGHFLQVLQGLVARPDLPIQKLPILTADEQCQLLPDRPALHAAPVSCLHTLFVAQVARTPDTVAIVCGERHLTYAALDRRAAQLAGLLRARGVGPDVLVGLCVDRTPDLIIGVLGILKAGGAYLPLDPAYPRERLAFMLQDAQVAVLLTAATEDRGLKIEDSSLDASEKRSSIFYPPFSNEAAVGGQWSVVDLVTDWGRIAQESGENPTSEVTPDNLAYVIYTSGSTGRPKGVQVTHANVVRLFASTDCWFQFGERDVWTLFHSIAFDFSVWELWGALLYGGRLVVVPYLVSRDPQGFHALVCGEQVTVLNQTPSAFRQFIAADSAVPPAPLALRYVIFGGEALDLPGLQPWFARHGEAAPRLVNMYGITETTVHVTYRPISVADARPGAGSAIGRGLPDLPCYVLDRAGQMAPIGVPGELYVGGAGVARGYLNRPDLTAERFVPDPFARIEDRRLKIEDSSAEASRELSSVLYPLSSAEGRLYRTGDLVRWRAPGELEYLGRIDHQVKLRGFRIELGEIEAVLEQHPGVREVCAIVREDMPGERWLVAYIVPKIEDSGLKIEDSTESGHEQLSSILYPRSSDLRAFLKTLLPDYMVPAAFVLLDALPLTPSGKLDRRALPAPDQQRPQLAEEYVAPRSATEAALERIWAGVLGLERVGIHDNFFALGGDSMRSVQVLARAKEQGMPFSLQQLFHHQTIATLVAEIPAQQAQAEQPPIAPPFSLVSEEDRLKLPAGVEDAYPLTMLQAGMLYHMALTPDGPDYHNVDSVYYRGRVDIECFRQAVRRVVARHPILRTGFDLTSYSEPLQLVYPTAELEVSYHDLRHLEQATQEQAIRAFFEQECRRPFNIAHPTLLRLHIHQRGADTFQFTVTEFHPILDGWSLSQLTAEIFMLHDALLEQPNVPPRPPLRSNFRAFVARERAAFRSPEHQQFWEQQMGDSERLRLPRWPMKQASDRQPSHRLSELAFPAELCRQLRMVARELGLPLKSVLLAAHLRVLALLSGQVDVVTGLVTHGRLEERDGEQVYGLFLNTLPLRLPLRGGTWRTLIRQTFAAEQALLPFRHYPQAAIKHSRGGTQALFEAVFNYSDMRYTAALFQRGRLEDLGFTLVWHPGSIPLNASFTHDPASADIVLKVMSHTAVLSDGQMAATMGYYAAALRALADDIDQPYETADLLGGPERERLVGMGCGQALARDIVPDVLDVIGKHTAEMPHALAVAAAERSLTYAELDRRSTALSARLRALGVGPDVLVGLLMTRSPDLLVGILGVLKAGGAYVPLAPDYPPARLASMLEDSHLRAIITEPQFQGLAAVSSSTLVILGGPEPEAATPAPMPPVHPDQLAYILYTSGSTGRPKGAMITRGGLNSYLHWCVIAYPLDAGDGAPVHSSIGFDLTVTSLLAPLLAGRSVFMLPETNPAENMRALLDPQRAWSFVKLTPSHLDVLGQLHAGSGPAGRVHALIIGGEALRGEQLTPWQRTSPGVTVINEYGPTETVVGCCVYSAPADQLAPGPVPIGKPISGAQLYVLDRHLQVAPLGVPGELYIGGLGLARGYLDRPDLTAERFIPNPFLKMEGRGLKIEDSNPTGHEKLSSTRYPLSSDRLYRTGDLARFLPDGNLEFLGRNDDQVKIQSFRIELGEIQAVLSRHPAVRESAVIARDDGPNGRWLVAYIVPGPGAPPTHADLRAFLQPLLPPAMIPARFVALDMLPLTEHGKLDRRALPAPDAGMLTPDQDFAAPRDQLEQQLAALWAETLGLPRVSIHDDFFMLGGHSLLALRLIARVQQVLRVALPLQTLFEAPSVAGVAARVAQGQATPEHSTPLAPTRIRSRRAPTPTPVDQLSDAEVDALLKAALDQPEVPE